MLLNQWNRGLSAAAALALALTLALPASAADPLASGGFAEVLISAQETDIPEESLQLALYQRDSTGAFQYTETLDFTTPVNRVTKDVELHVTPNAQQVTLTVDYLTDLNGDGAYELLTGEDTPVWDVLTASGSLAAASSGVSTALTTGRTYTISADDLLRRGTAAIQDRTTSGSTSYLPGLSASSTEPESVIYMVTVTYYSSADDAEYELCYYLRLYEELPAPSAADYQDVPADAWYYGAVDYAVSHNYLSGTTRSQFSPDGTLTRAMLAQILYQVAGQPGSGVSHYSDVPDDSWCYAAVSWASETGIMDGSNGSFNPDRTTARQELAEALYRFAQNAGLDTQNRADLSIYDDASQVASWARAGVEWAVSAGLLAGRTAEDGSLLLSPGEPVTRAEFAAVLQTLCESVLP